MENNQEQHRYTPDDIPYAFIPYENALQYLTKGCGLGDYAEDIYQEMSRKLYKAREEGASLTVQLSFTALRNLARSKIGELIRRRKQQQKLLDRVQSDRPELKSYDPEEIALRKERIEILRCTIKEMPKRQRVVMRLKGRGLTFKEIGRIMILSPTTVRDDFHRGCKRIEARFIAKGLAEPERPTKLHKQETSEEKK